MAIPKSFDCAEAWPSYVTSIIGQDLSWHRDAACRRRGNNVHASAWTGTPGSQLPERDPDLLNARQMALAICAVCPVQWDCVLYALETNDVWNVCATDPKGRRTLTTSCVKVTEGKVTRNVYMERDWRTLIEMAREARISIIRLVNSLQDADEAASHTVISSEHGIEDHQQVEQAPRPV